jgi:hypothetical protein
MLCFIITCTQKEANEFSLWNNNLGYQGILEFLINELLVCLDKHRAA